MAMKIYRNMHRSLFAGLTEAHYGGQPAQLYDRNGNSMLGDPPATVTPTVTAAPTISGDTVEGGTLTGATGTASGTPAPTAARQWLADGVAVSGATGATFTTTGRAGQAISLRVTWSNGTAPDAVATSGAITVTAAPPQPVAPTAQTAPSISPATGPVGTVFTITKATYAGTAPITVSGTLTQAGADVTAEMDGDSFTSTAEGTLTWTETASNGTAPDATQSASADVTAISTGIAVHYGTGVGQIPTDLRIDDPTVSGSLVTAVRNEGGAGALFSMTAPAGQEPTHYAGPPPEAFFGAGGVRQLVFANQADLQGTEVYIPTNIPEDYPITASGGSRYLVGGARSIGVRRPTADTLYIWLSTGSGGADVVGLTVPFASGRRIYSIRLFGGQAVVMRDGDVLDTLSIPATPFLVDRIGWTTGHSAGASSSWPSVIGRTVVLVVDSIDARYPAQDLIEETLGETYLPDVIPTITAIPDQTMTAGDADRVIPLTVTNAAIITISPDDEFVVIDGTDLILSAPSERASTAYTVTVTSSTGHTAGRIFALTVEAAAVPDLPVTFTVTEPTAERVYQRSSEAGGAYDLGEASVPVTDTADDAFTSLEYRLRDADTSEVLVDWTAASAEGTAGVHELALPCPACLGQYVLDMRANGDDSSIKEGTSPFAVGTVILAAGQSQLVRSFSITSGDATPIADNDVSIPDFGRVFGSYFDSCARKEHPLGPLLQMDRPMTARSFLNSWHWSRLGAASPARMSAAASVRPPSLRGFSERPTGHA